MCVVQTSWSKKTNQIVQTGLDQDVTVTEDNEDASVSFESGRSDQNIVNAVVVDVRRGQRPAELRVRRVQVKRGVEAQAFWVRVEMPGFCVLKVRRMISGFGHFRKFRFSGGNEDSVFRFLDVQSIPGKCFQVDSQISLQIFEIFRFSFSLQFPVFTITELRLTQACIIWSVKRIKIENSLTDHVAFPTAFYGPLAIRSKLLTNALTIAIT